MTNDDIEAPRAIAEDEIVGTVWHSNFFVKAAVLPYTCDLSQADPRTAMDIWREILRAQAPEQAKFPDQMYWNKPERRRKVPGHLTRCDYYVISGAAAEVFGRFDLRGTRLFPVRFFESDRETPLPGDHFCVSFGETKEGVIVDLSDVEERYGKMQPPPEAYDGCFTLRKSALGGCDLWLDSVVSASCFMSDGLASALVDAGIDTAFALTKCNVIDR